MCFPNFAGPRFLVGVHKWMSAGTRRYERTWRQTHACLHTSAHRSQTGVRARAETHAQTHRETFTSTGVRQTATERSVHDASRDAREDVAPLAVSFCVAPVCLLCTCVVTVHMHGSDAYIAICRCSLAGWRWSGKVRGARCRLVRVRASHACVCLRCQCCRLIDGLPIYL